MSVAGRRFRTQRTKNGGECPRRPTQAKPCPLGRLQRLMIVSVVSVVPVGAQVSTLSTISASGKKGRMGAFERSVCFTSFNPFVC